MKGLEVRRERLARGSFMCVMCEEEDGESRNEDEVVI